MFKKIYLILLILSFSNTFAVSNNDVYIFATVNDKIITNFDIKREINYLKILNPNLSKLEEEKILELSKNSLINELIKKSELEKFFDLDKENPFADEYLKNLYLKLNFTNEKVFENALIKSNNYSINQVKKKLRIEILWNELIYKKYGNQVKIDKNILIKKVESFKNKTLNEYLLSEIIFKKSKDENIDNLINDIKLSIQEIGFDNAANIYSISDSSKIGGNIGWIKENNLSDVVYENLKNMNKGEYTDVIQLGNNYLILKINEIRTEKILINKEEELNKMIKFETNKQLNQFSKIYFDKTKINYNINEN